MRENIETVPDSSAVLIIVLPGLWSKYNELKYNVWKFIRLQYKQYPRVSYLGQNFSSFILLPYTATNVHNFTFIALEVENIILD